MTATVFIVFHTIHHHIYKLSLEVQKGLEAAGVTTKLFQGMYTSFISCSRTIIKSFDHAYSTGDAFWRSFDQDEGTSKARRTCYHGWSARSSRWYHVWIRHSLWHGPCTNEKFLGWHRSIVGQASIRRQICRHVLFYWISAWSKTYIYICQWIQGNNIIYTIGSRNHCLQRNPFLRSSWHDVRAFRFP